MNQSRAFTKQNKPGYASSKFSVLCKYKSFSARQLRLMPSVLLMHTGVIYM